MANFNCNENLNVIFEKLENFLKTETVVGEPLKIDDTTIIPFINITFGLGSGGGSGADQNGNGGDGGGSGVGARVAPTAILVIKDGKVELLPIKKCGGLDKLLDMVPGIVEKVTDKKEEKEAEAEVGE